MAISIAAPAVDVNMPKEVHWLYPSKGFVLYCTESQSKNLLIQFGS